MRRSVGGLLSLRCEYISFTPRRYFLLCVNYFFYGETVTDYFFTLVQREEPLRILSKYHRFISFALYLTGTNIESRAPTVRACRPCAYYRRRTATATRVFLARRQQELIEC